MRAATPIWTSTLVPHEIGYEGGVLFVFNGGCYQKIYEVLIFLVFLWRNCHHQYHCSIVLLCSSPQGAACGAMRLRQSSKRPLNLISSQAPPMCILPGLPLQTTKKRPLTVFSIFSICSLKQNIPKRFWIVVWFDYHICNPSFFLFDRCLNVLTKYIIHRNTSYPFAISNERHYSPYPEPFLKQNTSSIEIYHLRYVCNQQQVSLPPTPNLP